MKSILISILLLVTTTTFAQEVALKTNVAYWATTTLNLGAEIAIGHKMTIDLTGQYNPFKFGNNKKITHWAIQPGWRYWTYQQFAGHFFGIHAFYAQFNMCGIKMFDWEHKRYQGDLYGGGISYGYHWILGKRWSLEGTLDVGYAHITYDKYRCEKCGPKLKEGRRNYVGPTKIGINLIYIIK